MTWLCTPRGQASRIAGDERLGEAAVTPRRRWEFEGLRTIAELVADGSGCALLPETVAMTQPAGRLFALRLTPSLTRHVHLLTRASTTVEPHGRGLRHGDHGPAAGRRRGRPPGDSS